MKCIQLLRQVTFIESQFTRLSTEMHRWLSYRISRVLK